MPSKRRNVAIIGGGLAGLVTAIRLARADIAVTLFEKKRFPFHRVCGEYISNETIPFLKSLDLFPDQLHPARITHFQLTSNRGISGSLPLEPGGFGISRFAYDHWLMQKAIAAGVRVLEGTAVTAAAFQEEEFLLKTGQTGFQFDAVVGAFGKRSSLDKHLNRSFMLKRSPYLGVKYHVATDHPKHLIALHNFPNGYCGISQVENGIVNLCYLSHRMNLRAAGDIKEMEKKILCRNPYLKRIFENAEFLFSTPVVINEVSFDAKLPVEKHIFMVGDAAGMIAPLCGNGMAMAIHSAKLLAQQLIPFCDGELTRRQAEENYSRQWNKSFARRLWAARKIQGLFGGEWASQLAVMMINHVSPVAKWLMSQTHGKPF